MRWTRTLLSALLVLPLLGSVASADWYSFWERSKLDFHRNTSWPHPFQEQEREAVRAPFRTMVNKGWQVEHTLTDWYFNQETQQLTPAGEMRLRYLLSTPEQRRAVFVLQAPSREMTAIRVDSVQQSIARLQPEGQLPPVYETQLSPHVWPGSNIDLLSRKFYAGQPAPKLQAGSGGGAGGGSGN
ncbi:hypothetical protein [Lignipirellula cremea]|uniref:Uncharacterized protein n=1 Tax=Lignipirellula cremea TaxID=2528010 RepID=A0A518DT19_9BACT|nr:hypothetical protein [Lignipirellula cremea]QDU94995.1 hypothetical protein Pla8534_28040 [Lignipirellula cremea]